MKIKPTLIVSAILLVHTISYSQDYSEVIKLVASDRDAYDLFGFSVSISGNYAIVGAWNEDEDVSGGNTLSLAGSAYIYERDINGNWNEVQKIVASDREADDRFGRAVDISGNYAIIGAVGESEDVSGGNTLINAGSAYIFEHNGNGNWNEVQKIVTSDRNANDFFGYSVGISGNYIIVSAILEDEDAAGGNFLNEAGSAYIFERDISGTWNEVQKIVASDRAMQDMFGYSVNISGNYAIVGVYHEDEDASGGNTMSDAGSAYIFERDAGGNWNEVQKIVASDREANDQFGYSVWISGDYIIVGAPAEEEDATGGYTYVGAGSAYIFERDAGGNWNEVQKIVASDRDDYDYFGYSVCISDNYAIVGAEYDEHDATGGNSILGAGSAYIFKRDVNGDWNEVQKIVASDREIDDYFGISVCISGDYSIVGAFMEDEDAIGGNTINEAGSAYIFESCEADYTSDPDNVIENGSFETCVLSPWNFYNAWHLDAIGTYQLIDGTCILTPTYLTSSPQWWHVQIEQALNAAQLSMLDEGATYTLEFDAWGELDNMSCHVFFGQNEGDYIILLDELVELTTSPQTFSFDFPMSTVFSSMKIALEIGLETTWVGFNNVSLIKKVSSGVSKLSNKNDRRIVPNPATAYLDIFVEAGSNIRIYSSSGLLIKEFVAKNNPTTYDISVLNKGIYLITISKEDYVVTKRVIIQ